MTIGSFLTTAFAPVIYEPISIAMKAFKSAVAEKNPEARFTYVKVATALEQERDRKKQQGLGGKIDIRLYNNNGELIGKPMVDKKIASGDAASIWNYQSDKNHRGQQATYGMFTGNKDDICIAYVTVQWPDRTSWMWLGDWAPACNNAQWYYSNLIVGTTDYGPHSPRCIWIGNDRKREKTAFSVYFPDFYINDPAVLNKSVSSFCETGSYATYKEIDPKYLRIHSKPPLYDGGMGPLTKHGSRSIESAYVEADPKPTNGTNSKPPMHHRAPADMATSGKVKRTLSDDQRLVATSDPKHSAKMLCASDSSFGPSMMSMTEKAYCDMRTKTLYPFCADGVKEACFDPSLKAIVAPAVGGRKRAPAPVAFSTLIDWDQDRKDQLEAQAIAEKRALMEGRAEEIVETA